MQSSSVVPASLAVERAIRHVRSRQQRIQDARSDFTAYKRYVWRRYRHAAHLEMIDRKVSEVVRYVETGGAEGVGRLMIWVPPRHGKALALDTPIPTPSGWTTMGELKVGDLVFDEKGQPTRVTWVSPVWKDRPVYEVVTDDGDSIVADAEHEWLVRLDRKWPVQHLKTTRYLAERTSPRKPMVTNALALVLPEAELPIDPYVLGVWLGDGHSRGAIITDQSCMRAEIERAGHKTTPYADPTAFGVSDLHKRLRLAGLLQNKHIPDAYLRGSKEQRLALLQGLVDTDGYVSPDGQVEFCSTNIRLAEGVSELVHSLGYKASIILGRATLRGKDCGPKYRVMFYMPNAARTPRKRDRCIEPKKQPNRYLTVKPAGTADTVCIEVEAPSHLFLCGRSMLPTHNSVTVARLLPPWFMGRNPDMRVIQASYGASLSEKHSRFVRDLMKSGPHLDIFPGVSPSRDSGARDAWDLRPPHEGGMDAVGKGGAITGKGANLIIADDLVKSRSEAESLTIRNNDWEWWKDDLLTRLEPGGGIILINCMTGDTPVLMADGTERPLASIRPGDRVATYANGALTSSVVRNHQNNGPDSVFAIRTTSGRVVRANKRHPFLVEENGQLKWIRVRNLSPGQKIVTVRDNGESGEGRLASNTSDFTTEVIVSVEPDGVEDVYDVEIEGTANFIANGVVSHNTRWHEDDVAGRIALNEPNAWDFLVLPALALENDPLGRLEGEPLWPERFSRSALERARRTMGEYSFEALYQQNPRPRDGGLFRRSAIAEHILNEPPSDIVRRVRYWDLAMSDKKTADWTCGVLLGYTTNGNIIVLDVARAQVDWSVVPSFISEVMLRDGPSVPQGIEGAFYQSQMTATLLRMPALMRHSIRAFPVETDKWQRALPWSARWGAGQVYLLRRTWTSAYIDEHCSFPQGTHDDQVDASSGALNALAGAMRPVTVVKKRMMA